MTAHYHQYELDFVAEELREPLRRGEILTCGSCGGTCKVYQRHINAGMALSLLEMYNADPSGTEWLHVPTVCGARSREEGKLAYWELLESKADRKENGALAGFWRPTAKGALFADGQVSVPYTAHVYQGRVQELDGPRVHIWDALGKKFNYDELMGRQGELF